LNLIRLESHFDKADEHRVAFLWKQMREDRLDMGEIQTEEVLQKLFIVAVKGSRGKWYFWTVTIH
jgi:hypothetical protein